MAANSGAQATMNNVFATLVSVIAVTQPTEEAANRTATARSARRRNRPKIRPISPRYRTSKNSVIAMPSSSPRQNSAVRMSAATSEVISPSGDRITTPAAVMAIPLR